MTPELPAFGVCGWSGSGKTILLVELVRHFAARGMKVAVVKDDIHGPDLDVEGKDSDRLFRAGADVVLTAPGERLGRTHLAGGVTLEETVRSLDLDHDLVLLEGHKRSHSAAKVWLLRDESDSCPLPATGGVRVLRRDEDRVTAVVAMVEEWLVRRQGRGPVCAGILIGGGSRRMGQPKHLLRLGGVTWLEHIVESVRSILPEIVILGAGSIPPSLRTLPTLADIVDRSGPLAGMLAAMRWRPEAAWVFIACDMPQLSAAAVEWLLRQRAPGVWAILPRLAGVREVEPLFALYEFRARTLLERSRAPSALVGTPATVTPELPGGLAEAWFNVNTPSDAARVVQH